MFKYVLSLPLAYIAIISTTNWCKKTKTVPMMICEATAATKTRLAITMCKATHVSNNTDMWYGAERHLDMSDVLLETFTNHFAALTFAIATSAAAPTTSPLICAIPAQSADCQS